MQHLSDMPKEDQEYHLGDLSTVFDPSPSPQTLAVPPRTMLLGSSTHSHNRSISSESGSSLVERTQILPRTHPSLPGHPRTRRSPDSSHASPPSARERYASLPSVRRADSDEDEDSEELEPLDPNATEEEKRVHKRRQNTLAARRSRAKRAQELNRLREENSRLNRETAIWKERALMMERLLASHGLPCPNFSR